MDVKLGASQDILNVLKDKYNCTDEQLKCIMYNVITPKQLSILTGIRINSIYKKMDNGKLNCVYPFPTPIGDGPRFINCDIRLFAYLKL